MEIYNLEKNIPIFYTQASSFPNGVEAAHKKLHEALPEGDKRRFFGISYSDKNGEIIYKAAAEELLNGEAETLNFDTYVIKKGKFMSQLIPNFCDDLKSVSETFKKLLATPELDPQGYCLEMYINDTDMLCMVPLKNK